jgi:hypothetical protein
MKAAAIGLAVALLGASPSPLSGVHRDVQFSSAPLVIECPATMICLIDLKPGERVTSLDHAQLQLWSPQVQYSGGAPHLVMRPDAPNRRANFSVTTDGKHPHLYWVMAISTAATDPMMRVTYHYDAENRHDAVMELRKPRPTPTPSLGNVLEQQMTAACAANHDAYGITPLPPADSHRGDDDTLRANHPADVCHTESATFIRLSSTSAKRADLPVLVEETSDGDRSITPQYADGIYRATDVAGEYALVQGRTRVRIQWQPDKQKDAHVR